MIITFSASCIKAFSVKSFKRERERERDRERERQRGVLNKKSLDFVAYLIENLI